MKLKIKRNSLLFVFMVFIMMLNLSLTVCCAEADSKTSIQTGDYIDFGKYYSTAPFKCSVIHISDGAESETKLANGDPLESGRYALLLVDKVFTASGLEGTDPFDADKEPSWDKSDLRNWMNATTKTVSYDGTQPYFSTKNGFLYNSSEDSIKGFHTDEYDAIAEVTHKTLRARDESSPPFHTYDTAIDDCMQNYNSLPTESFRWDNDRAFCLSIKELYDYAYVGMGTENAYYRGLNSTGNLRSYWLRTPAHVEGMNGDYKTVRYVGAAGVANSEGTDNIRPAMWVDLDALVFQTVSGETDNYRALAKKKDLTITVKDADNNPIEGVAVKLTGNDDLKTADGDDVELSNNLGLKTDSNGECTINNVFYSTDSRYNLTYTLSAQKAGFETSETSIEINNRFVVTGNQTVTLTKSNVISVPDAPMNLTAVANSKSAMLNWSASDGATCYKIYQGTTSGDYNVIGTTADTSYTVNGLTNDTTYYFTIKAINTQGDSDYSNEANAKPQAITLDAPQNLIISDFDVSSLTLSWDSVAGATGYRVYRKVGMNAVDYTQMIDTSSTTFKETTLMITSATATYKVTAYNSDGESGYSNLVSGKPKPGLPTGLTSQVGDKQVTVSWDPVEDADSYNIHWGLADAPTTRSVTADETSYTFRELENGKAYRFKVAAKNSGVQGDSTEFIIATPAVPSLGNFKLNVVQLGSKKVMLSWEQSENATKYMVYKSRGSDYQLVIADLKQTFYWVEGLSNEQNYIFYVEASDEHGQTISSDHQWGKPFIPAPTTFEATPQNAKVQLDWSDVIDARDYSVCFKKATDTEWVYTNTGKTHSCIIWGLENDIVYDFRIKTIDADGFMSEGYQNLSATPIEGIAKPQELKADFSNGQIKLTWNEVEGATGYKVYKKTGLFSYAQIADNVSTNSYIMLGANLGTTYYFQVKAFNGTGDSEASNEASITPSASHSLTFLVTSSDGNCIEDATVEMNNQNNRTTDKGVATFSVNNGDYSYSVSKIGYTPVTGVATVNGGNKRIDLMLLPTNNNGGGGGGGSGGGSSTNSQPTTTPSVASDTPIDEVLETLENKDQKVAKAMAKKLIEGLSKELNSENKEALQERANSIAEKIIEIAGKIEVNNNQLIKSGNKIRVDLSTVNFAKNIDEIEKAHKEMQALLKNQDLNNERHMDKKIMIEIPSDHANEFEMALPDLKGVFDSVDKIGITSDVAGFEISKDTFGKNLKGIVLSASKLDRETLPDHLKNNLPLDVNEIIDLNAFVSDEKILKFNIPIQVSLPYSLKEGEDSEKVTIYLLNDNGEIEKVAGRYDAATGRVNVNRSHFSKYFVSLSKDTFKDIQNSWAKQPIEVLAGKGIVNGKGNGIYDMNGLTTRAEFASLISRMLLLESSESDNVFQDITEDAWYAKDVFAMYEFGMIKGTSETLFSPNRKITREEAAVIIANVLDYLGDVSEDKNAAYQYMDENEVSSWAKKEVKIAQGEGIMTGYLDGEFKPLQYLNRAEIAQIIYKLYFKEIS